MRMMRIGILGGTFDPIHNGHLYLAREVCKRFSLARVIFIPTHIPPHKTNAKITAARHRYNMVKMAIGNNKKVRVSDIEIKRKGRSYSIETLKQLRKGYGRKAEIFFIAGSDSLKDLNRWKNLREILELCKFIVVRRPGFSMRSAPRQFVLLNINAKNISSRCIRTKIKRRESIARLVPKKVLDYIKSHGLYQA